MKSKTAPLKKLKAWRALATHAKQARALHLRDLFREDPQRGARLTAEAA
jgi:glucose-6-phosphate isomerase